jgi:Mg/Co/Ni transporter MgtE
VLLTALRQDPAQASSIILITVTDVVGLIGRQACVRVEWVVD